MKRVTKVGCNQHNDSSALCGWKITLVSQTYYIDSSTSCFVNSPTKHNLQRFLTDSGVKDKAGVWLWLSVCKDFKMIFKLTKKLSQSWNSSRSVNVGKYLDNFEKHHGKSGFLFLNQWFQRMLTIMVLTKCILNLIMVKIINAITQIHDWMTNCTAIKWCWNQNDYPWFNCPHSQFHLRKIFWMNFQ